MSETLDTLSIQVNTNAGTAAKGIDALANSLKHLGTTTGQLDMGKVAQSLEQLNSNKLVELANALSGLSEIKISERLANSITKIAEAADKITDQQIDRIRQFSDAMSGLKGIDISGASFSFPTTKNGNIINTSATTPLEEVDRQSKGWSALIEKVQAFSEKYKVATGAVGKFRNWAKATLKMREMGVQSGALLKDFARIAKYRILRTVLKEVTQAIREGVNNLYLWTQANDGALYNGRRFSDVLDRLKESALYLKNAIGTALAPIIEWLERAFYKIADAIVALINKFNNLIAAMSGQGSFNGAIRKEQSFVKETNKAAKAVQNLLFGFDELNIIPAQNAGGADNNAVDVDKMFETLATNFSDEWVTRFQKLRQSIWPDVISIVTACGAVLAALTGHPVLAATLLATSIFSSLINDDGWDEVDDFAGLIKKVTAKAVKIIGICAGMYLALTGHPWAGAIVALVSIGASKAIEGWDGTLQGLADVAKNVVGYAIKIISVVGGIWLALKGHPWAGAALAAVGLMAGSMIEGWDSMLGTFPGLIAKITGYAIAILSILGGMYLALHGDVVFGITLAAVGVMVGIATASWDAYTQPISDLVGKLTKIVVPMALILAGIYVAAHGNVPLGIGLLVAGGVTGLFVAAMSSGDGWDANIENLKQKLSDMWQAVKDWWSRLGQEWSDMKEDAKKAIKDMLNGMIDKLNAGITRFNNSGVMEWLNKIGGYAGSEIGVHVNTIPRLASGGIVDQLGSLFIAGEAGPEFVTQLGGQTQVYNEDQLSASLANANEELINVILQVTTNIISAVNNKDLTVNIGDREIASSAQRGARLNGRAMVV